VVGAGLTTQVHAACIPSVRVMRFDHPSGSANSDGRRIELPGVAEEALSARMRHVALATTPVTEPLCMLVLYPLGSGL
jgi:hypothetical protein